MQVQGMVICACSSCVAGLSGIWLGATQRPLHAAIPPVQAVYIPAHHKANSRAVPTTHTHILQFSCRRPVWEWLGPGHIAQQAPCQQIPPVQAKFRHATHPYPSTRCSPTIHTHTLQFARCRPVGNGWAHRSGPLTADPTRPG